MKQCQACHQWFETLDRAHIKSFGSSGCDDDWNLLNLCRADHSWQHSQGWKRFSERYPSIMDILEERGFYFDSFNKLRRDIL